MVSRNIRWNRSWYTPALQPHAYFYISRKTFIHACNCHTNPKLAKTNLTYIRYMINQNIATIYRYLENIVSIYRYVNILMTVSKYLNEQYKWHAHFILKSISVWYLLLNKAICVCVCIKLYIYYLSLFNLSLFFEFMTCSLAYSKNILLSQKTIYFFMLF